MPSPFIMSTISSSPVTRMQHGQTFDPLSRKVRIHVMRNYQNRVEFAPFSSAFLNSIIINLDIRAPI